MKKVITVSRFMLLMSFLFFYACKKNVQDVQVDPPAFNSSSFSDASFILKQIEEAKTYFTTQVESNSGANKLQRKPMWEQAYIAHTSKGDKVIVPIDFLNCNYLTTNFSGDKKFPPKERIHLEVYKDKSSKLKAVVVGIIPNQNYLEKPEEKFSGYIIAEDWSGNTSHKYFYKNGTRAVPEWSDLKTNVVVCTYLSFYLCSGDNGGGNCILQWRIQLGCSDDMGLEPPGDGGEFEEEIVEMNVSTIKYISVPQNGLADVIQPETVNGVKSFSTPSPSHNFFTGITNGSSYLVNGYSDCQGHAITYDYHEDSHGSALNLQSVSANFSGHYIFQPIYQGCPDGNPQTKTVPGSKAWIFQECF